MWWHHHRRCVSTINGDKKFRSLHLLSRCTAQTLLIIAAGRCIDDDCGAGVSSERLLQNACELAVAVGDVLARLHELREQNVVEQAATAKHFHP